jgi:hypothetical protein
MQCEITSRTAWWYGLTPGSSSAVSIFASSRPSRRQQEVSRPAQLAHGLQQVVVFQPRRRKVAQRPEQVAVKQRNSQRIPGRAVLAQHEGLLQPFPQVAVVAEIDNALAQPAQA